MRTLYDAHAARVQAVLRRIAGDDALAEDWSQEAWIRAFASLDRFRADSRFSTWLHRIAVNVALNGHRRTRRRTNAEMEFTAEERGPTRNDSIVLRVRLERALDELPHGMRTVIVLHDIEGLRHEDVAHRLGISVGTSKSQLFRARAKLRDILGGRARRADQERTAA